MIFSKARFIAPYNWLIYAIGIFIIGCSTVMSIHNIRRADTSVDKSETDELMLMTYNIRAGGGTKNPDMSPRNVSAPEENLVRITEIIKFVDPDIVGLQEVRGFHQAKFIAEKLNLNYVYSAHGSQTWWGLAILSKYEIVDSGAKKINFGGYYGDRIALRCKIDVNAKKISVVNVHYALENYYEQAKATMKLLNNPQNPLILMGDLNRKVRHPNLSPIREKLVDTCSAINSHGSKIAEKRGTFGALNSHRIDHIYIDINSFLVVDVGVVPFVDPKSFKVWDWTNPNTLENPNPSIFPIEYSTISDHLAYFAKVKLKK